MAEIIGSGAPTKRTEAAVGDTYIDESTGKQYKCVMAYHTSLKEETEYQWKQKEGITKTPTASVKKVSNEKTENVNDVKPAELKREQKRKSYSSYSK